MVEPRLRRRSVVNIGALLAYVLTTVVFHWPLPLRLGTALTGPVTGDTGIYVWNLWVFRHEIVAHGRFPLFTSEILSPGPPVDLSLHNYTLFANVLAFPLIPLFGVVASFNIIYLALSALAAWTMYLLAREVVGRVPEAWLAGLLFGFSPVLVARSTAHFSLTQAAPIPLFLLFLIRAERHCSWKNAVAVGATIAWATLSDPYFGVYCVLVGACYLAARRGRLWIRGHGAELHPRALHVVDGLMVFLAAVVATIGVTGGTTFRLLGQTIGLMSLYTPVLLLTLLAIVRVLLRLRPWLVLQPRPLHGLTVRCLATAGVTSILLLSPLLYALQSRLSDGGMLHRPIFWRSSPRGVDLLALFMPNPSHKLFGAPWRAWLTAQYGGYVENVAALTLVALFIVGIAILRYHFRPPRVWLALVVCFGALALGPFVHVGGVNTFVPGPWALLRYIPVISATRTPARFAIVLMMAFAVVFALALAHIADRWPGRRRQLFAVVGLALAFELAPLPRRTPAVPFPDIYQIIAADPRDIRVIEIPFGFMHGEGAEGAFSSEAQFYQTVHQKPILGGAMSRISDNQLRRQRRFPILRLLVRLSEGKPVDELDVFRARQAARRFIRSTRLGYVVIDTRRTSPELRELVIDVLGLVKVAESDGRELYEPRMRNLGPSRRHRGDRPRAATDAIPAVAR